MRAEWVFIQKVLMVSGLFFVAVLVPLIFGIPGLTTQIQLMQKQSEGAEYFTSVYALLKLVEEHRASMLIYLNQPNPYDQAVMIQKQGEIDGAFNALGIVDRRYGGRLGTTAALLEMRHQWNELVQRFGMLDMAAAIQVHNAFISNALLPFMRLCTDRSQLMMGLNQASFYSAISLTYTLPDLAESLGRMQAYGIKAMVDRKVDKDEQDLLVYILNEVKADFTYMQATLDPIINTDLAFQTELRQRYVAARQAVEQLVKQYETRLAPLKGIAAEEPEKQADRLGAYLVASNLELRQYGDEAARTLNELFKLSAYEINVLKAALRQGLSALQWEKASLFFMVSALFLLAFTVCLWVMHRIKQGLSRLRAVSQDLAPMVSNLSDASSVMVLEAVKVSVNMTDVASTVDQVGQMARLSIDKARSVLSHAENVVRLAEIGQKSNEAISAHIHHINSQVAAIEQVITSLHSQSQAIGSIISSMEELTRQSNLLALNASLEAIKAGEYGKGFDVVAQEINRLAKQSQQATDHIRSILDDIKVSVAEAVSISKQGKESVVLGVKQSIIADQSFADLSVSVSEARQAAGHIVDSSEKQFAGVEKIIIAFKDVKRGSVQNAEKIKKVQQSTQTLQDLSFTIKACMDQLRL